VKLVKFSLFVSIVALVVLFAGNTYSDSTYTDSYIASGNPPPVQPEDVPKSPSGLGILIVPNCNPIHFQTNSDMAPYGAGGSGMGLACNPSDLSGPSQNPANKRSRARHQSATTHELGLLLWWKLVEFARTPQRRRRFSTTLSAQHFAGDHRVQ